MKKLASVAIVGQVGTPAFAADTAVEPPLIRKIWRLATTGRVPQRSLIMAVAIGSLLSLINQYDAMFGIVAFNWYKAALTYCVPYIVATYGAVTVKW